MAVAGDHATMAQTSPASYLKIMAVVRKGESTPWSTDHAKWIFTNRGFFFARKAAAGGVNLNLRVDAIGHFRMVNKNNESNWEAPRLDGTMVSRQRVSLNN